MDFLKLEAKVRVCGDLIGGNQAVELLFLVGARGFEPLASSASRKERETP